MTVDTISEFIRQNGAFGVLVLLILAFVWKGVPWMADRYTRMLEKHNQSVVDMTEKHDAAIKGLTDKFDQRLEDMEVRSEKRDKEFTEALANVADNLGVRMTGIENAVKGCGFHQSPSASH